MSKTRTVGDSMGSLEVPLDALYGAQTQRAVENFQISGLPMPAPFLHALAQIKAAAATANAELGELDQARADAIVSAVEQLLRDWPAEAFPVDVFQTGSGTSSNMNMNEVLATLASRIAKRDVHANDDVNCGQSSNDVVPTAIQLAAASLLSAELLPALQHLRQVIDHRAAQLGDVVKTGRTHLMDATPLTFGQELSAWSDQLRAVEDGLHDCQPRLHALPLGGTAVGTGLNAHPGFSARAVQHLAKKCHLPLSPASNRFAGIAGQGAALELAGQLNCLAACLSKICNDLRWMNSGPLAGLGEIELPALQPGSSIMPGKVNPVIPEAVLMVCAHVSASLWAISSAAQSGNFQLNVMLPLVAHNLLLPMQWIAQAMRHLADKAIAGFVVCKDRLTANLQRNPILVTALNPLIGYDKAAAIAKRAYREGRPVLEVAIEDSGLEEAELRRLLDPMRLTASGAGAE
ncbi:class II fumarate hydratase [Pseudomarimonas arenosa]|uniref:Fumarate hydratase class II n=1 Tax=Pseudomarimonas arenosa TaxID=2774145 RepID=A0AAW3ZT84_9GAMM|nr:class II fumarate hydratase [Pseudomarimonas arenosa]MBD8527602.1 class II fumarate hydratase [Pseudomarimonas arenosa]